jgi:hypothetical protein
MSSRDILVQILYFFLYITLQILLVRNFVLFDVAFCFVYIAFILLLPFEIDAVLLLLFGFGTGLMIDVFYDTLGIHAAACVLTAFVRPWILRFITPRGGYEVGMQLSIRSMGLDWFAPYAFILILIHHLTLFFIEASDISLFFTALLKAFCSAILTWALILITQYLFSSRR